MGKSHGTLVAPRSANPEGTSCVGCQRVFFLSFGLLSSTKPLLSSIEACLPDTALCPAPPQDPDPPLENRAGWRRGCRHLVDVVNRARRMASSPSKSSRKPAFFWLSRQSTTPTLSDLPSPSLPHSKSRDRAPMRGFASEESTALVFARPPRSVSAVTTSALFVATWRDPGLSPATFVCIVTGRGGSCTASIAFPSALPCRG